MTLPKNFVVSMASSATLSEQVDLGANWAKLWLGIPTMPSAADIYIQASVSGTTYRRLAHTGINTSSVQLNDFRIASTTSQRFVEIPYGFQFAKIELSTANTTALSFDIVSQL